MPNNNTKAKLRRERRLTGGGPWLFEPPALDPNEQYSLDLRNMRYNDQKGWFRKWLPLDSVSVTNLDGSNGLRLTVNGQYNSYVVPNAVETFSGQGITHVRVTNEGSATIAAGDVKIELTKEPYNADAAARQEASKPWLNRALGEIIPGGVPGFGGGRGGR